MKNKGKTTVSRERQKRISSELCKISKSTRNIMEIDKCKLTRKGNRPGKQSLGSQKDAKQ